MDIFLLFWSVDMYSNCTTLRLLLHLEYSHFHLLQFGIWLFTLWTWDTGRDFAFNATMIGTAKDFEETIISPVSVPWVGDEPIVNAILCAPAKNSNCMATKCFSKNVFVDTCSENVMNDVIEYFYRKRSNVQTVFVVQQIFVNSECSLNGSIFVDFFLNLIDITCNWVWCLAEMLVFFIWHIVTPFAFFHTFRCFAAFAFAWTTGTVHMMLAWLDFVRTTTLIRSIWSAGDNTFVNPIAPRSSRKTTIQNQFNQLLFLRKKCGKRHRITYPLQPKPHVWQHDTKSSAEIWTFSDPLLWMQVCMKREQ